MQEHRGKEKHDSSDNLGTCDAYCNAASRTRANSVVKSRAEVLTYKGRKRHRHTRNRQEYESLKLRVTSGTRHDSGTKSVDIRLHHHIADSDNAVLNTGGEAD